MPETCLGSTCAYIHIVSLWVKLHLLPFAPFFAPMIAVVAGCIAVYSIHVTRSVARRRAAIDFFLKTDMDKGMVEAYVAFQTAVRALDKHREDGKSIETFIRDESGELSKNYQDLNTYLNIHELVAVGIKNRVFDETVCFNFWSDALVLHTEYTREFVDHIAASEGEEASYLELRKLSCTRFRRHQVRCFMELEVCHGETEVYARVQG